MFDFYYQIMACYTQNNMALQNFSVKIHKFVTQTYVSQNEEVTLLIYYAMSTTWNIYFSRASPHILVGELVQGNSQSSMEVNTVYSKQ